MGRLAAGLGPRTSGLPPFPRFSGDCRRSWIASWAPEPRAPESHTRTALGCPCSTPPSLRCCACGPSCPWPCRTAPRGRAGDSRGGRAEWQRPQRGPGGPLTQPYPSASSATTSPRAWSSSPTSKVPTWTRLCGSGRTSSGPVRGGAGARGAGAAEAEGRRPLNPGSVLPPARRPLPGPGREPQRAGLWLRGARVPGRAAGAPRALRGAGATAAGLHAAVTRGRPALAAAPSLLRRQPQDSAFPGAAAAPGERRPGRGRAPVTGPGLTGLGFSFYCSRTNPFPPPCKHGAVRSRVEKASSGGWMVKVAPGSSLSATPQCSAVIVGRWRGEQRLSLPCPGAGSFLVSASFP